MFVVREIRRKVEDFPVTPPRASGADVLAVEESRRPLKLCARSSGLELAVFDRTAQPKIEMALQPHSGLLHRRPPPWLEHNSLLTKSRSHFGYEHCFILFAHAYPLRCRSTSTLPPLSFWCSSCELFIVTNRSARRG